MAKPNIEKEYVRALHGKRYIHLKYPLVANDITLCKLCTNFEPANREDGQMCKLCQKHEYIFKMLNDFQKMLEEIENSGTN